MKKLIVLATIIALTSCAHIRTSQTPLPTMKYLKTKDKPSAMASNISVIPNGESVQAAIFCYMNISAWGNQNANQQDLLNAIQNEAKKLKADYILLGDFQSQQVGSLSQYIGYGITTNSPLFQNSLTGTVCNSADVSLGIVHRDGKIEYVKKDSLAEKKGLKEGMKIIAINGRAIASDPNTIAIEINSKTKGEIVDLEYIDLKDIKKAIKITLE